MVTDGFMFIKGKVASIDKDTNDTVAVENASVHFLALPDSISIFNLLTDKKGVFGNLAHLDRPYKKFALKVSALGLNDTTVIYDRSAALAKKSLEEAGYADFGTIVLKEKTMTLEELKVVGELKKMFMRGDTLIYNTDAFKMPKGSVLLELVRRMPGMSYDERGILMYGNRPISEIRLNGQSFFKDNMGISLNNMPTKELDQLKIYESTNPDDTLRGDYTKRMVMDMKTKRNVTRTIFANLVAGSTNKWGKYLVNGDANIHLAPGREYTANAGISCMPSNVSTMQATGLSMNKPEPNVDNDTRKVMDVRIREALGKGWATQGSYIHTHDNRVKNTTSAEEQFLSGSSIFNLEDKYNTSKSNGNIASVSLFKSFKKVSVSLISNVSRSKSGTSEGSTSMSFTENPFAGDMSTDFADIDTTYIRNKNRNERSSFDDQKNATVSLSFSQLKRTINSSSLIGNASFSVVEKESSTLSFNNVTFYNNSHITGNVNSSQLLVNPSKNLTFTAGLIHNFRTKRISLNSQYSFSYIKSTNERTVFQQDNNASLMGIVTQDAFHGAEDKNMYRDFTTRNLRQNIKSTMNFNEASPKGLSGTLSAGLSPEHINANTIFKGKDDLCKSYDFFNWTINASLSQKIADYKLSLSYNASTSSPSIFQLLPIIDNSNPLLILKNNPDLHNKQVHGARLSVDRKLLRLDVGYDNSWREIGEKTTYNIETGAQERMLVNVKGGWGWSGNLSDTYSYGMFSVNGKVGYSYRCNPRIISYGSDDIETETKNKSINADLTFKYGNEKWDAHLMLKGNWAKNISDHTNELLSPYVSIYTVNATLKRYIGEHFDMAAGYYNTWRHGSTLSLANGSDACLNFNIRYKFLNGRGSLTFNAFDVFSKQKRIDYSATSMGNKMTKNDSMNRYVLLTFAYKFQKLW